MSEKRSKKNPAEKCTCSKCRVTVASAIPGKPHRRCGGGYQEVLDEATNQVTVVPAALRGPHNRIPGPSKGVWMPASDR